MNIPKIDGVSIQENRPVCELEQLVKQYRKEARCLNYDLNQYRSALIGVRNTIPLELRVYHHALANYKSVASTDWLVVMFSDDGVAFGQLSANTVSEALDLAQDHLRDLHDVVDRGLAVVAIEQLKGKIADHKNRLMAYWKQERQRSNYYDTDRS